MKSFHKNIPSLNRDSSRRSFLKHGVLAGGSLLFLATGSRGLGAETPADSGNPVLKTIHGLRSIHGNFLDRPLPELALQAILQASLRAAGASNMQSYSIIVVKDRKMMGDLCGYRGSCLLLYCADYNRLKASAESLGYHYDPGTIEDLLTATINTMLAVQTAVIAAKSLGIDSLLTNGVHRGDMERHWKLLDLPPTHCFPVIALVLGYPTQEPAYQKGRLDGAGVIHEGKYHRLTKTEVEEITRKYDDKQRHLGLIEDWDAQGFQHYLDWFYKAWMDVDGKPAAALETPMLRRLKRCGFIEGVKT